MDRRHKSRWHDSTPHVKMLLRASRRLLLTDPDQADCDAATLITGIALEMKREREMRIAAIKEESYT